ncbi:MAG: glycosyltransferase family 1 protein [Phycisphaerales bacterium]|nr:glycosyltransferase family 1 protein [Phycisphaerales bacterium]
MRMMLFTDTLGDVNGVSRFIRNMGHESIAAGQEMLIATSTRFEIPPEDCFFNCRPKFAMKMPKYAELDFVIPNKTDLVRRAEEFAPDVVHVSTPGGVGKVGRDFAKKRGIPIAGVYHTDFPAYLEHLFNEEMYGTITAQYMKYFYKPFELILSRSEQYMESLEKLNFSRDRMAKLEPGIKLDDFDASHRDESAWDEYGLPRDSVKILYVGRISTEKNLPVLTEIWPNVRERARSASVDARLVVIGGGPYLSEMQSALGGHGTVFPGFKHGTELAKLYASADMFVFPSLTDTLGQVVLESQASGIPVIVADQGGPKEVVDDGATGLVLPGSRPAAWVDAVSDLVIDHERRKAMGAAGVAYSKNFSISASFEKFWAAHEALIKTPELQPA